MPQPSNPEFLDILKGFDTPTICNALEVVSPERRGHGYTSEAFVVANASLAPMVGYARTATIRAVHPSALPPAEMSRMRGAYYEYVAKGGPAPALSVIQDLDPEPGYGAFWGEVNSAVHQGLGCLGCVTDGSFRDIDELAAGFQILGGKIGPSHAFVHLEQFACQVNVHGMTVNDGDLIHADKHGAVVLPAGSLAKLPAAIDLVTRREAPILAAARSADFNIDKWLKATADAAEIH